MDIVEFQEKLTGLCELAKEKEGRLSQEQIRAHFEGMELETSQLVKILQYLKAKGISIEGGEGFEGQKELSPAEDVEGEEEQEHPERSRMPLSVEEETYLREYLEGLPADGADGRTEEELFLALSRGDAMAMAALAGRYLPVAAEMAADWNCREIPLADLIQEANVGLLTALEKTEPALKNDGWLRGEIRRAVVSAIEEQTQRRFQDDCLVARVEKLESAVKELTDEDGETRFTVEELAVILDMDVQEIRSVLRLTGDDK